MTEAGVIVRQFDALSKTGFAWEPCADHLWCSKFSRIWPSSIINRDYNNVLYRGEEEAGLVLAPPPLNRFHCIFPGDGNSMGHLDEPCQDTCTPPRIWDCSFPPHQLEKALQANHGNGKYNEVVIDAQYMKRNLPRSIMGIFYMAPDTKEKAKAIHSQFVAHYGAEAADVPLLKLNLKSGFSRG